MAQFVDASHLEYMLGGYYIGWNAANCRGGPIEYETEWKEVARWHPWEEPKGEPPVRRIQSIRLKWPNGSTEWEIADASYVLVDPALLGVLAMVVSILPVDRILLEGRFLALHFRRSLNPREAFYLASYFLHIAQPYELENGKPFIDSIPDPLDHLVLRLD